MIDRSPTVLALKLTTQHHHCEESVHWSRAYDYVVEQPVRAK